MTRRLARPFAIAGWLAAVVGAIFAIALRIADPVPVVPNNLGFTDPALVSFEFLGLTFASVGVLLVVRRPGNAVGWCMVLIGAAYALSGLASAITYSAAADGPTGAGTAGVAGWFAVLFAMIGALIFGLGLIFPTGRGHTPAWDRFVVLCAIAMPVVTILLFLVRPGPLQLFPTIDNPFGVGPDFRQVLGPRASDLFLASGTIFAPILAWSIVSRYRMSDAVGRQQLKWFVLALVAAVGVFGMTTLVALISEKPPEAGLAVFGFAGALVPVAIGIAILRHGLYDIDRIISRSLAYLLVTGVLLAVFTATSLGLSLLLGSLAEGESLAVAASTLVVFALFGPLRHRVQSVIDQRFDRSHYDAAATVHALTVRLREDIDLERVEADVLGVVGRTFHPTSSGLWIRRNETTVRRSSVTIPERPLATVTST
ncbi:MAG: hypothetical protein ABJC39_09055 [Chloroflexota bacterium]